MLILLFKSLLEIISGWKYLELKGLYSKSINILYSKSFQNRLKKTINPYGNGGASIKILNILKKIKLKNILIKKFYDV